MKIFILMTVFGIALARKLRTEKFDGIPPEGVTAVGDMLFYPKSPGLQTASVINGDVFRWPDGIVPYEFDSSFVGHDSAKAQVAVAIAAYPNKTDGCITLREKNDSDTHWISFRYGSNINVDDEGCYSCVGMIPQFFQPQRINFPQWCLDQYGSIEHEIAHALGFYHEQSRPDRDDYVIINYKNIENGVWNRNFKKKEGSLTSGTEYDYLSVMHYPQNAFSVDGTSITITTKDPKYQNMIGQRDGLSEKDIKEIKLLYGCPADSLPVESPKPITHFSLFFTNLQKLVSDFKKFVSAIFYID